MSSEKVICFTDSRGNPLFSLPDSSFLCLEYGNGDSSWQSRWRRMESGIGP